MVPSWPRAFLNWKVQVPSPILLLPGVKHSNSKDRFKPKATKYRNSSNPELKSHRLEVELPWVQGSSGLRSSTPLARPTRQWLLGEMGKEAGEGQGRVPQCCPPVPHPQALLSLSCVVASKTWKCHRA